MPQSLTKRKESKNNQKLSHKKLSRYYIFVGNANSWEQAFKKNIWGFPISNANRWKNIMPDEYVAFYVTSPISKIVGFGKIQERFIDDTPYWAMEKYAGKVIWNHRVNYEIIHVVDDWNNGISLPSNIVAINGCSIITEQSFLSLVKLADTKWKTKIKVSRTQNMIS